MAKWFRFPFGVSGDRQAIPDEVQPGGEVSYAQGFGPDYELELGVDPGAKSVPRDGTNQFYFDVTDALRWLQLYGVPEWFPASANGGVAISYPLNAIVRRGDLVYRSIVANNTVEPGTDPASWVVDGVAGPATTGVAGLTRYATNAEAVARTATDRAVTPANLGALYTLLLNNPVFPEVLGTGLFTLTNPANTVRIAAGTQWVHRGVNTYTSELTNLPTVASKTYHLRWDPTNGFALYDLASGTYNPSAVPETDPTFDSSYDNMLVARVVTNASNVATITPLLNRDRLASSARVTGSIVDGGSGSRTLTTSLTLNWARTPSQAFIAGNIGASSLSPGGSLDGYAGYLITRAFNRYLANAVALTDWETGTSLGGLVGYTDYSMGA